MFEAQKNHNRELKGTSSNSPNRGRDSVHDGMGTRKNSQPQISKNAHGYSQATQSLMKDNSINNQY